MGAKRRWKPTFDLRETEQRRLCAEAAPIFEWGNRDRDSLR
jgi:hypothetical protein